MEDAASQVFVTIYNITGHPQAAALEDGAVVLIENETFSLQPAERDLVARGVPGGTSKNISYDPAARTLKGTHLTGADRATLISMMSRFSDFAERAVLAAAPGYQAGLKRGRTSFRPQEIANRDTSWRKDDRRRHIDAFPATPTGGARILRVFANIDQHGTTRKWRVGPDFETYAKTFLPAVPRLAPGAATLFAAIGITKTRRRRYDEVMLGLHDAAKADLAWQDAAPAQDIEFQPGQSWMVFTDQVPHAAISGRNALEQSFYITSAALQRPDQSPLAILTRLTGRDLNQPLF
jgi:hypothetical protein